MEMTDEGENGSQFKAMRRQIQQDCSTKEEKKGAAEMRLNAAGDFSLPAASQSIRRSACWAEFRRRQHTVVIGIPCGKRGLRMLNASRMLGGQKLRKRDRVVFVGIQHRKTLLTSQASALAVSWLRQGNPCDQRDVQCQRKPCCFPKAHCISPCQIWLLSSAALSSCLQYSPQM
jgi:hypothetical protein